MVVIHEGWPVPEKPMPDFGITYRSGKPAGLCSTPLCSKSDRPPEFSSVEANMGFACTVKAVVYDLDGGCGTLSPPEKAHFVGLRLMSTGHSHGVLLDLSSHSSRVLANRIITNSNSVWYLRSSSFCSGAHNLQVGDLTGTSADPTASSEREGPYAFTRTTHW